MEASREGKTSGCAYSEAREHRELEDAATLVELGEMEGDEASENEGLAQLRALKAEGERMVGDDIAEDGIRYLQAINFKDGARAVSIAAE